MAWVENGGFFICLELPPPFTDDVEGPPPEGKALLNEIAPSGRGPLFSESPCSSTVPLFIIIGLIDGSTLTECVVTPVGCGDTESEAPPPEEPPLCTGADCVVGMLDVLVVGTDGVMGVFGVDMTGKDDVEVPLLEGKELLSEMAPSGSGPLPSESPCDNGVMGTLEVLVVGIDNEVTDVLDVLVVDEDDVFTMDTPPTVDRPLATANTFAPRPVSGKPMPGNPSV